MSDERIIEHIRKRKDIGTELWSIKKLLEKEGMEMYVQLCCDRIAGSGKIDGEHVQIDFSEPGTNILVDWRGFAKCGKIISGYIGEDEWDNLFEIFHNRQKIIDNENSLIRSFRDIEKKNLRQMMNKIKGQEDEAHNMIRTWIKEEIKSRGLCNKSFQKVREILEFWYVRIKYYRLFGFLKRYGGTLNE